MRTQELFLLIPLLPSVTCTGSPPSKPSQLQYPISNHTVPLLPLWKERQGLGLYAAQVAVGSQIFNLGMDTGSSDTWLMASEANCTDSDTLRPVAADECAYVGARYKPDASFEVIPDRHLNASFGNGLAITGPMGRADVIFGGLTVPKQEISAVTYASSTELKEGNISGLLGLSYETLTSSFPGTDPSKDIACRGNSSCGPIRYPPFITTLFQHGLTEPFFSFALSRDENHGGVMTIGGIPRLDDISVNATDGVIASVPIKPVGNNTVLTSYTVDVDDFLYSNSAPNAGQGQYMVDTGTIPNILPAELAQTFNALYDPPATLDETRGAYTVACDARVPELAVRIGGQIFPQSPKDMILREGDQCYSAVQASKGALVPILGASWIRNTLAVFDVGASEITFVGREHYKDS